jgi:hypothetical protein
MIAGKFEQWLQGVKVNKSSTTTLGLIRAAYLSRKTNTQGKGQSAPKWRAIASSASNPWRTQIATLSPNSSAPASIHPYPRNHFSRNHSCETQAS